MNNVWSEIKVAIPPEQSELIAEIFQEEGAGGIVFDEPDILDNVTLRYDEVIGDDLMAKIPDCYGIRAYFPVDDRLGERLLRIKERLGHILEHVPEFQITQIREDDWAESWKTYFKPERIGQVVIKPSWEEFVPADSDVVIDLDPGMAFGTGTHPTTRLCLKTLQTLISPEISVLDLGTGSGILAITAAKLGAGVVTASDVDPLAVNVARENIARNGLNTKIPVMEGNLLELPLHEKFDLVVANIIADIILKIIPGLSMVMKDTGRFLASGIIQERCQDVKEALTKNGYTVVEELWDDGWVALVAARK